MIDFSTILVDHEGETNCGRDCEFDPLMIQIQSTIKGKPERQTGDGQIIEAEEPDWKLIKKNSLELCSHTHNLEVYISLARAMMHLQGYAGLADGSALIAAALERYWDCIYPQIDPDDIDAPPIERTNLFKVFEDPVFLVPLEKLELIYSKQMQSSVSLFAIRRAKNEKDDDSINQSKLFDAIFRGSDQHDLENLNILLDKCSSNFSSITNFLIGIEQIGTGYAPSFDSLLKTINESKLIIKKYSVSPDDRSESIESEPIKVGIKDISNAAPELTSSFTEGINSREDVISALVEIEDYFNKNEPGSPIPLLLRRAKNLVDKDFISLIEDLAPDSVQQLGVILGTKEE